MDRRDRIIGRAVDYYVQKLFTEQSYTPIAVRVPTPVLDKCDMDMTFDDKFYKDVFNRLKERLSMEYTDQKFFFFEDVVYDFLEADYFHRGRALSRENIVVMGPKKKVKFMEERFYDFMHSYNEDRDTNLARFDMSSRCCGISTRQADSLIQKFFDLEPGESIDIVDHYGTGAANKMLTDHICRRLENEYKVKFRVIRGSIPKIVKVEN